MKARCHNPKRVDFAFYGGRGVTVCTEWRESFVVFRDWALSHGYRDDLTIDRIDVTKGYEPDNCRFIPQSEQPFNRRDSHFLTYQGETKTVMQWVRDPRCPITEGSFWYRLSLGWSIDRIMAMPNHQTSLQ
jgi:hypothetical protein